MQVSHFMSKTAVCVSPTTPLTHIWKLIFEKHIHGIPVVDKNNKLLGIIAEEDMLKKLFPDYEEFSFNPDNEAEVTERLEKLKHVTAEKIMNSRVYFTRSDTLIMRALSRMMAQHVRQLPVLDENDHVVGMLSKADVFRGLFRK
jgi:CBS-domain-containing membrane protein